VTAISRQAQAPADLARVAPRRGRAGAPVSAAHVADADRGCRTGCGHSPDVEMVVQLFDCIPRNEPWGVSL